MAKFNNNIIYVGIKYVVGLTKSRLLVSELYARKYILAAINL